MADPLTLTLVTTAISGGISAYGANAAGEASADQYNYKAGVAQVNKRIAEQNRDYSFASGGAESTRFGQGAAQRMGKIKTAQAASGIAVNSGSAKLVQESQHAADLGTEKQIADNAGRRAYGFQVQAENFENEASMNKTSAINAKRSGEIGAISSLVSTATSVASKWYQGSQNGLGGGGGNDPWKGLRENDVGSGSNYYAMA